MMTDPALSILEARIGELLRLQALLEDPDATLNGRRSYLVERLAALYPLNYHVYRRRWEQLAAGEAPGDANWPRLNYLEWRRAVDALAEEARLAKMMGEEGSAWAREWRAMLMVGPAWVQHDGES